VPLDICIKSNRNTIKQFYIVNLTKTWLGDFLGDFLLSLGNFFTKTSGHPGLHIHFACQQGRYHITFFDALIYNSHLFKTRIGCLPVGDTLFTLLIFVRMAGTYLSGAPVVGQAPCPICKC